VRTDARGEEGKFSAKRVEWPGREKFQLKGRMGCVSSSEREKSAVWLLGLIGQRGAGGKKRSQSSLITHQLQLTTREGGQATVGGRREVYLAGSLYCGKLGAKPREDAA